MLTTKIVLARLKAIDLLRDSGMDPWLLSQLKGTIGKIEAQLSQEFQAVALAQEKRIAANIR